jgi:hypothetical protein
MAQIEDYQRRGDLAAPFELTKRLRGRRRSPSESAML